ncbi:unnamed protein product [Coregonus sp. 'balchen']|nr:unnamed protein product [Coregonus sp. 'balchen']
MFISSDAGNNWRQIFEEEHNVWFLDKGGALVAGEPCVMDQKQNYMKRRPGNYCMLGKDYAKVHYAESCICRAYDFEW